MAIPLLELTDITRRYQMGETTVHALREVSFTLDQGAYVAIMGTSGSGKSTLMNLIGLLDQPTSGTYQLRGTCVDTFSKRERDDLRNQEIGFVFQRFNLLARAPAYRQVELPLFYAGTSAREARRKAIAALEQVGLGERSRHRPEELSGGQQQRVAIARALVNQPSLLLADEPTGALDTETGQEVLQLFRRLNQQGLTVIVVTHDPDVAREAERIITLRDGRIVQDETQSQRRQ